MVLILSDLNKAQIYELPYRDSPHREIEIIMSFNYMNLFKPKEHTKDYHIRKPNNENFLFQKENKIYLYVGEILVGPETKDELIKKSSVLTISSICLLTVRKTFTLC